MSVKPILFNTEMVKSILDGRKTCTRRAIKFPNGMTGRPVGKAGDSSNPLGIMYPGGIKRPPYQPGDILYVRETWCDDRQFTKDDTPGQYFYKASPPDDFNVKWHPSIHMPKEAARIWLKVKDVRVERLQDMDWQDALYEGIDMCLERDMKTGEYIFPDENPLDDFIDLWNSTIKKSDIDRYGWDANPYVWVIEFERCAELWKE